MTFKIVRKFWVNIGLLVNCLESFFFRGGKLLANYIKCGKLLGNYKRSLVNHGRFNCW